MTTSLLSCTDMRDAIELFPPQGLYLKPIAKLNISVQLPQFKLPGKTISNWEVMENLRSMIKPEEFTSLKVSKSTLEFIRFEGEIQSRSQINYVIARLDTRTIKLSGFTELLKIRAAEAKINFPTRHSWNSYFRDAKNMNEMKPGERPDTLHINNLPCKWFSCDQVNSGKDVPSEYIFKKVFEVFGEVRCVDIPTVDPYRNQMKSHISGIKTFTFEQDPSFEGYVQYKEYMCFVKAMDSLRGMKLLRKEGNKAYTASIKVDFDKTKHLSNTSVKQRLLEREKLMSAARSQEEKKHKQQPVDEKKQEEERQVILEEKRLKAERRRKREEKRKERVLSKLKGKHSLPFTSKIAIEERKLLIAQRKLESIRLLDELFERVKIVKQKQLAKRKEAEEIEKKLLEMERKKENKLAKIKTNEAKISEKLQVKERELRAKLLEKLKSIQEKQKLNSSVLSEHTYPTGEPGNCVKKQEPSDPIPDKQINLGKKTKVKQQSNSTTENEQPNPERCRSIEEKQQQSSQIGTEKTKLQSVLASASKTSESLQPLQDSSIQVKQCQHHWSCHEIAHPYGYIANSAHDYCNYAPYYHHQRGSFYPRRRGFYVPRWQRYRRGNYQHMQQQQLYDSYNEEYYRYFQRLAWGSRSPSSQSRSLSQSSSSSHSRHRRRRSRNNSRSRRKSGRSSGSRSSSSHKSHSTSHSRSRSRKTSRTSSQHQSCSTSRCRTRSHHQSHSPRSRAQDNSDSSSTHSTRSRGRKRGHKNSSKKSEPKHNRSKHQSNKKKRKKKRK